MTRCFILVAARDSFARNSFVSSTLLVQLAKAPSKALFFILAKHRWTTSCCLAASPASASCDLIISHQLPHAAPTLLFSIAPNTFPARYLARSLES